MWDKNKAGKRVRYVEAEGLQVKSGKMRVMITDTRKHITEKVL